jgi:hypothetical protein
MNCQRCGEPMVAIEVLVAFYKCDGNQPGCEVIFGKPATEPQPEDCQRCGGPRVPKTRKLLPVQVCPNPKCPP